MPAPTIGQYLLEQLQSYGVGHVFGVPGDYVPGFYRRLVESPLRHIGYGLRRSDSEEVGCRRAGLRVSQGAFCWFSRVMMDSPVPSQKPRLFSSKSSQGM